MTEQLLDLVQKNSRYRRDGLGPVREKPLQPLWQGDSHTRAVEEPAA